jgi:hypothetical protein
MNFLRRKSLEAATQLYNFFDLEILPLDIQEFAYQVQTHYPGFWQKYSELGFDEFECALQHRALLSWVVCNMPIFRPTPTLAAMLTMTDFGEMRLDELKLPFNPLVVEVPLEWTFASKDGVDGRAAYVLLSKHKDRSYTIKDKLDSDDAVYLQVFSVSGSLYSMTHIGARTVDYWTSSVSRAWDDLAEGDDSILSASIKLAIGTALFIAERGRGKLHGGGYTTKSRQRRDKKLSRVKGPNPTYLLGVDIAVDKDLVESASALVSDIPLWRVKKRFVVRGHWRMQACGAGHSERRRTWIKPFMKGPQEGERLVHAYVNSKGV